MILENNNKLFVSSFMELYKIMLEKIQHNKKQVRRAL